MNSELRYSQLTIDPNPLLESTKVKLFSGTLFYPKVETLTKMYKAIRLYFDTLCIFSVHSSPKKTFLDKWRRLLKQALNKLSEGLRTCWKYIKL